MTFYTPQEEQRIIELSTRVQSELGEQVTRDAPVSVYFADEENPFQSEELRALPMSTVYFGDLLRIFEEHRWSYKKATMSDEFLSFTQYARNELLKEGNKELSMYQQILDFARDKSSGVFLKRGRSHMPLGSRRSVPQGLPATLATQFLPLYELQRGTEKEYLMRAQQYISRVSGGMIETSATTALLVKPEDFLKLEASCTTIYHLIWF